MSKRLFLLYHQNFFEFRWFSSGKRTIFFLLLIYLFPQKLIFHAGNQNQSWTKLEYAIGKNKCRNGQPVVVVIFQTFDLKFKQIEVKQMNKAQHQKE